MVLWGLNKTLMSVGAGLQRLLVASWHMQQVGAPSLNVKATSSCNLGNSDSEIQLSRAVWCCQLLFYRSCSIVNS